MKALTLSTLTFKFVTGYYILLGAALTHGDCENPIGAAHTKLATTTHHAEL